MDANIFERSVDPIANPYVVPKQFQIFERYTDCPNQSPSPPTPSPQHTHDITSSPSHAIEDYVPSCLDATAEVVTNSQIDLREVNVLLAPGHRRRSASLIQYIVPSSPTNTTTTTTTTTSSPNLRPSRRNDSVVSRRLSDIYFKPEDVVPFYSYHDMLNAEKLFNRVVCSGGSNNCNGTNPSNVSSLRRRSSNLSEADVSLLYMDSNIDSCCLGQGLEDVGEMREKDQALSVCSMSELLKCKSNELREGLSR